MRSNHFLTFAVLIVAVCCLRTGAADWPTDRGDTERTGDTTQSLPKRLSHAWTYRPTHAPVPSEVGGIRPGCWINALPVGGLVLVPDAWAGCQCSYQNRSWMALSGSNDP